MEEDMRLAEHFEGFASHLLSVFSKLDISTRKGVVWITLEVVRNA
jgi:hypothetical protein